MFSCAKCEDVPDFLIKRDDEYVCAYCYDDHRRTVEMPDPFASDWICVNETAPAHSYIKLHRGYKRVHSTQQIPDSHEYAQVLLDYDEHGTILGIELLVPGTLVYDKKREEVASDS